MARKVAREEYEHLCWMIEKWNHNRVELFEITMPNENLEFEGIMRFYFQSTTRADRQKVATKCIRVSNTANTNSVIEALVQKFRPDMRMLNSSYALYEVHSNDEERRLESDEYPLMVQLGWVDGDKEGRFLLRRESDCGSCSNGHYLPNKRPTKRSKKVKREREGIPEDPEGRGGIARSLYNVMPESKFTRSISKKNGRVQVREGAEDTLRVYADSLLPNGSCKSLLISAQDTSAQVVRSSLEKYGLTEDPSEFCLVQVVIPSGRGTGSDPHLNMDYTECVLGDSDRPLQWKGGGVRGETVQFHLRRKDSFAQRPHSTSHSRSHSQSPEEMDDLSLPALVEIVLDSHTSQRPHRFLLSADVTEIGSSSAFAVGHSDPRGYLCINSPSIKPRHCVIQSSGQSYSITPLEKSAVIYVNSTLVHGPQELDHHSVVQLGDYKLFRFFAPVSPFTVATSNGMSSWQNSNNDSYNSPVHTAGDVSRAKSVENIRNPHQVEEIHQSVALRRLREKAFSEYDLQAQMMAREEEREETGELGGETERKRSDPRVHAGLEDRHSSPRKRHPSAPSFNPSTTTTTGPNGTLPDPDPEEWHTPLSLSFHQTKQQLLLKQVVTEVDSHQVQFKLAPAYGLYMMARHIYWTEPQAGPGSTMERRKTIVGGLRTISSQIKKAIKECRSDPGAMAFWLANSSELLHFLQHDYQLGPLSNDYDISFTHTIHLVYKYFVTCMIKELQVFLPAFYDDSTEADREETPGGYNSGPESVLNRVGGTESDSAASRSKVSRHSSISYSVVGSKVTKRGRSTIHDVLQTLSSTITLLKRCRVNVTLSIMIFSNLFRYISTRVFNRLVGREVKRCGRSLGQKLAKRLGKLKSWAEREGMELPANTHLEMVVEAANLLQASKKFSDNAHSIYCTCSHLNSIQVSTLLEQCLATDGEAAVSRVVMDDIIHMACGRDEILRGEGLEVRVEEDLHPELIFHIPGEGYSGEMMVGVPSGLREFLQPMISAGLCSLTVTKESSGLWTPPVRNVVSSQSVDRSASSQNAESPHNFNTLPKTTSRSRKSSENNEFRHNTLPHHGDADLLKVTIAKDSSSTLGISIVEAKLPPNTHFGGETGIFIKSMVEGGPAQLDGRLRPGDQILEVDGNKLQLGCTQQRASQLLRNTGKKVTLVVVKSAVQYYGLSHILQYSPRYRNAAPEGSSHAKKAARRMKREQQKERQRQERSYPTEFRLERRQLEQHHSEHPSLSPTTQHSSVTSSTATTEPRLAKPLITKWIMEQNALYNSERGSETEGHGSNSSMSNIADQDGRTSSPVPSFATSSSRRTKSSYDRHKPGSPPVRELSGLPSRVHDGHSVSPFDPVDSLEAQTMSDSVSKFSDCSGGPEYSDAPPQSAPPVAGISYKDAFNVSNSLCSQQMSSSLTPYGPSQPGQLDKLSTDVMYHTPQSGASLSGISAILPRLLQGRGGKPYLGRVHLKELDGDEIDMEKQRIKLMFYEKKNEERALREEEESSSQAQDPPSPTMSRQYSSAPPPPVSSAHHFEIPTSLEEDRSNGGFSAFSDTEVNPSDPKDIIQELETLEHMVNEQRQYLKELQCAHEKESFNLKQAEIEFQERELVEPGSGGGIPVSVAHQEKWQKEQKKKLRQHERFRAMQREKIQKMVVEERQSVARLKAYDFKLYELRQQLEAMGSHPISSVASAAIVESHLQSYGHQSHPSKREFSRTSSGCSPSFPGEIKPREDQIFQPVPEPNQSKPEREWPQYDPPKPNPAQFVSMESIDSSSLPGAAEVPEFSREIVNTISESTNMTEPTQDEPPLPQPLPPGGGWASRYVANSDDPYAGEFASKYTYSDDEFFMDERRAFKPEIPIDAHYSYGAGSEREVQRSLHHHDRESPRLLNGHIAPGYHHQHRMNGAEEGVLADKMADNREEFRHLPQWGGQLQQGKAKLPPVSEKPQSYTSGRTDHHYSRSNRPRLHNRNHLHSADNVSTVSGVSSSSHMTNQNGDSFKSIAPALDTSSFSPSSSKVHSPTYVKGSALVEGLTAVMPPSHSPGLGPPSPLYSAFGEHPTPLSNRQHIYSVPSNTSGTVGPTGQVYDVPRKGAGKLTMSPPAPAIYDQPCSSPSSLPNHMAPASLVTSSPGSHVPNSHSPFHNLPKTHERPNYGSAQVYDVPKPQPIQDFIRPPTLVSSDRDLARQTASNMAAHPYQYHGLPTKAPRSYSRGRQDAIGFGGERGVRGQNIRPTRPQRVQRKQTEL